MKSLILSITAIILLCLLSFKHPHNTKVLYNAIDLETSELFVVAGPTGYVNRDSVWYLQNCTIDVLDTSHTSMMAVIINRYNQ